VGRAAVRRQAARDAAQAPAGKAELPAEARAGVAVRLMVAAAQAAAGAVLQREARDAAGEAPLPAAVRDVAGEAEVRGAARAVAGARRRAVPAARAVLRPALVWAFHRARFLLWPEP
jgi:hypothetical protein